MDTPIKEEKGVMCNGGFFCHTEIRNPAINEKTFRLPPLLLGLLFTHQLAKFHDEQEGDGLGAQAETLQYVWMLEASREQGMAREAQRKKNGRKKV